MLIRSLDFVNAVRDTNPESGYRRISATVRFGGHLPKRSGVPDRGNSQRVANGRPDSGPRSFIHLIYIGEGDMENSTGASRENRRSDGQDEVLLVGTPGWIRTIDHPIKSRMLYH
jgi:hypothetical protein